MQGIAAMKKERASSVFYCLMKCEEIYENHQS
nr:MAG TPA: hypothetical protein [Caudoviricetes sp.]